MKRMIILIAIYLVDSSVQQEDGWSVLINPAVGYTPCKEEYDIFVNYEPGLPPEEENKYNLTITKNFPLHTNVILTFDSDASITLDDKSFARVNLNHQNSFTIRFFRPHDDIKLTVKGLTQGVIPYLTSLVINNREHCRNPWPGYLDTYIQGFQDQAESPDRRPKDKCGRRQVTHTELIVNGAETKPGDWPWHVALYKINHANIKYICGGTLISKIHVLTAAHCVTLRGVPVLPETISVVLGKFNLIGGDTESQEREVYSLIVHKDYDHKRLDNDIGLMKLKSEVVLNDYIQPACMWYPKAVDRLPISKDIYGTIVGWGFEKTDALAPQLRKAKMPIVSDSDCIKSNPLFYSKLLTGKKFCAGYRNGTSACNGDSGSAFQVFVPDKDRDENPDAVGSWYVRGIVSVTLARVDVAICNPDEYVVFTDVEKYKTWIDNNIA